MTDTDAAELRKVLVMVIDRIGDKHLQTAYPQLWRRIQAILAKTEGN